MRKLDNIEAETLLGLSIERLRELQSVIAKVQDILWPHHVDLEEFLETYDEWKREKKDREDENE